MALTNYVSLTITRDSVGVARAGFGVPMLISYNAAWVERVRTYSSLAEVGVDFATTTPEYMAAAVLFGQSPRLETLKIGRGALPPTQRYAGSLPSFTAVSNHTYRIHVVGEGYSGTAEYLSDGTATNDEVVAGLVSALNGIAGNTYTAAAVDSGSNDTFTVTADNPGDWFSLEVDNADIPNLVLAQNHADPGIATDLAAITLADPAWYALVTTYNSKAYVAAAAAVINAQDRIYLWDAADTTCVTTVVASADDSFEDGFDSAWGRVSGHYHPSPAEFFACGLLGRCLPLEPGSETWALKSLSGPPAVALTSTHRDNIVARNANSYETVAGVNVTFDGKVFSGEYIDVVRGLDWLRDDMSKAVFEVLAGNDKVPFTDAGIALVENAMKGSLARAEARGIIAAGWTTTVPKASAVSTGDKSARRLTGLKFAATLQGAVHSTDIDGTVSV